MTKPNFWPNVLKRRFMIGHHVPDHDQMDMEGILSKVDPKGLVRELKKAGVQAFWIYSKCHEGNAYYPSKVGHVHSAMAGRDLFGEYVEACLSEEIVPLCIYEFLDRRIMAERHDWCHRKPAQPETAIIDLGGVDRDDEVGGPCLNGPYGDFAIEQALEVARNYPIEGYYVDFLGLFGTGAGVCPYCDEKFRKAFGFNFPGTANLTHGQYVEFVRWRYQQYDAYTKRMLKAIRGVRPGLPFVHNFHGVWERPFLHRWDLAAKNCTFLSADLFSLRDGTLRISWQTRALAGSSESAPGETLLDSVSCMAWDLMTPKALDSFRAELWTARSAGLATCTGVVLDADGSFDPHILALTRRVFKEQEQYEEWLADMRPVADVGVLRSQQSMESRPKDDASKSPGLPHSHDFMGWAQALIESHYLWDIVQDHQVRDDYLKRFKVLILPNAGCLSQRQMRAIRAFVEKGGVVIATGETSLYNENGEARKNFGLSRMLGVKYVRGRDPMRRYLRITDEKQKPKEAWVTDTLVLIEGQWTVKGARNAKPLGVVGTRVLAKDVNMVFETTEPGLLRTRCGKGKVYYAAGLLGVEHFRYGQPTTKRLMAGILKEAIGKKHTVALDAPDTVEVFAHTQKAKDHLVVGLVNNVTTVGRSASACHWGGAIRFDQVEEMPPVPEVRIRFSRFKGRKIKNVYLAPGKRKLPLKTVNGQVSVRLKNLGVYAMVIAEYEKRKSDKKGTRS